MNRLLILFFLLTSAGACTSQTVVRQSQFTVAPALTVERFLQAANARDLQTMSRLFGTHDGPIVDSGSREEIELRMDLIAGLLQHDDYEIISEGRVPGAEFPSNRIGVDLLLPGGDDRARCRVYGRGIGRSMAGQHRRGVKAHRGRVNVRWAHAVFERLEYFEGFEYEEANPCGQGRCCTSSIKLPPVDLG